MKRIFLIITILAPLFAMAQSENEMLDFSTVYYQGTAKSAAMGNAMGAVGSDFSAITINPAGLGLFRKSYVVWTPSFYATSTGSEYQGEHNSDRDFQLLTNDLGLSWTQNMNDGALKSVSFAFGINKFNNFALTSFASGNNPHTSLIDAYFTEFDYNGITDDVALEDYSPNNIFPLWDTYLIDFYEDGTYGTEVPMGGLNQQYGVSKRGSAKEFSFASGFNFNEKLFLGVSVGIPYFDRRVTKEYKEVNLNTGNFRHWTQREDLVNSGWGINAKIGAIMYPARWLRLGVSFHTPYLYKVTESWFTETTSVFSDATHYHQSPTSTYDYTVTTPYRINGSAALIFGNFGMITGDFEYLDYRKMRASSSDYNYSYFNDFIQETYNATYNVRVGTEWRWQTLAFRAGYAIYGSPYGFDKENLRTNSYSCGIGYTYHDFTMDLAYVFNQRKNTYDLYSQYSMYPAYYGENYEFVDETTIKETTNINQVVISFKLRLD